MVSSRIRRPIRQWLGLGLPCLVLLLLRPFSAAAADTASAAADAARRRAQYQELEEPYDFILTNGEKDVTSSPGIQQQMSDDDDDDDSTLPSMGPVYAPSPTLAPTPPTPTLAPTFFMIDPLRLLPPTFGPTTGSSVAGAFHATEQPTWEESAAAAAPSTSPPGTSPSSWPHTTTITWLPPIGPKPPPTTAPSNPPSIQPTVFVPSEAPTFAGSSVAPTDVASEAPTQVASEAPTIVASEAPTMVASEAPTVVASQTPTVVASQAPTVAASQAPSDAPSLAPTRVPSEAPTRVPSAAPSDAPSLVPSILSTEMPTPADSSSGSGDSTNAPTSHRPTTLAPTQKSAMDTAEPTARPVFTTALPTRPPHRNLETLPPTPSNIFKRTPGPSMQPTQRQFVEALVPIRFTANLVQSSSDAVPLNEVEQAWEASIFEYYRAAFSERPGVRVVQANLDVTEEQQGGRRRQVRQLRRLRMLQATSGAPLAVGAVGDTEFMIDSMIDRANFVDRAGTELQAALTTDFLQLSLDDAGLGDTLVSGVVVEDASESSSNSSSKRGSPARIAIGFVLLILTVASLMFWARVLWRKRQKKMRKRRLNNVRKKQSVTIPAANNAGATTSIGIGSRPPPPDRFVSNTQAFPTTTLTSEGSRDSSYRGIDTFSEEDASENISTVTDTFAEELQRAASLDRAAWEEFQRKQQVVAGGRVGSGEELSISSSVGAAIGIANASNVSVYDETPTGSQDWGVEVKPRAGGTGRFHPYGDEQYKLSKSPIRLTSEDAVKWTPAGVSLGAFYRGSASADEDSFEPYGETKPRNGRNLRQSWDLDEYPVKDESGPSQFSFLHPLKRKELSSDVPDARRPAMVSDDSKSSGAVIDSLEVTSVGTPDDGAGGRMVYGNTGGYSSDSGDSGTDASSQNELTSSMLQELEEISQYVKQYERKKEARSRGEVSSEVSDLHKQRFAASAARVSDRGAQKLGSSMQTRSVMDKTKLLGSPMESRPSPESQKLGSSLSSVPYDVLSDSMSPRRAASLRLADPSRDVDGSFPKGREVRQTMDESESSRLTGPLADMDAIGSLDSSDIVQAASEADDDASMRLGISRFSVEKPTAPLLSFKNSNPSSEEPLQFTGSLPASEEDSLRYSKSSSPERQRGLPKFGQEKLLDTAAGLGVQSSLSADSEEFLYFQPQTKEISRPVAKARDRSRPQRTVADMSDDRVDPAADIPTNKPRGLLSTLRSNKAILDAPPEALSADAPANANTTSTIRSNEATIDEQPDDTGVDEPAKNKNKKRSGFFARRSSKSPDTRRRSKSPDVKRRKSPRRSTNNSFNKIVSQFDSNLSAPIVPSNESWQYTGSIGHSGSGFGEPSSR